MLFKKKYDKQNNSGGKTDDKINKCNCGPDCNCMTDSEECKCDDDCKCNDNEKCECGDDCKCNDEKCKCDDDCKCDDNGKCDCGDDCKCDDEDCECDEEDCECGDDCHCGDKSAQDEQYKYLYEKELKKSDDYLNLAKRYAADFENYKKQNADIIARSYNDGIMTAAEKILPALDALDRARELVKDTSILQGIELMKKQLSESLNNLQVKQIEAVGKQFNPDFHNAIATVEDKTKISGTVIEEFQKGYMFKDKVLRYSVVKTVK